MPGMGELLIILLIVLLVFGAGKLPQIGDALGRSIKNFKRAANTDATNAAELEVSKRREIERGGADSDTDDVAATEKSKVKK